MSDDDATVELRREIRALSRRLADHETADEEKIVCPFTADEIKTLKRGVQVLETLGWLGRWVIIITGGMAALGVNWERIKAFFGGSGQ